MKNCDDEPSADDFVQRCQFFSDKVYERDEPLTEMERLDLRERVANVMMYKVGKIDYSFCNCCCVVNFRGMGIQRAMTAYKRLKIMIVVVLVINIGLQLALSILDMRFNNSLEPDMSVQSIIDQRNKVDFPIMGVQVFFGCFNIYQILVLVQF